MGLKEGYDYRLVSNSNIYVEVEARMRIGKREINANYFQTASYYTFWSLRGCVIMYSLVY